MKLLLIDNYDSFTWNLAQYFEELGATVDVRLNDAIDIDGCQATQADAWVISPGPGRPETSGITLEAVAAAAGRIPLLGVCLGHQAIAQHFGGKIVRAPTLMHGKTSEIRHDGEGLFAELPNPLEATRYHSLIVQADTLTDPLIACAHAADDPNVVMALRHREWPMWGVQFHPESILTTHGKSLLGNFLSLAQGTAQQSR